MAERSLSLDRLYELPPEEFTSARNELAKSLRADGRRAEADEVAALRKPTLGAWVSNQLARTRGDSVRALVEAGELLRKVQATGKGDLRAATQDERAAVSELLAEARTILQQAGRTPSEAALQPVRTTLAAAAASATSAVQRRRRRRLASASSPRRAGASARRADGPRRRSARRSGCDRSGSAPRKTQARRSRSSRRRRLSSRAWARARRRRPPRPRSTASAGPA